MSKEEIAYFAFAFAACALLTFEAHGIAAWSAFCALHFLFQRGEQSA